MKQLFQKHGSEHINSLLQAAIQNGSHTATVSGYWEIDTAIRLPSNFTLILQDCHLRMADGCFSNMFINEHHGTKIKRSAQNRDRKAVEALDEHGNVVGSYDCIADAAKALGLSISTIWQVCNKIRNCKTAGGYRWRYKE